MTRGAIDEDDPYARPGQPRFRIVPFGDIDFSKGDRWLVKGLLASAGLATIFGPPKQYKSFVALDVALHIAEGRPWAGRRVRQGVVVYICAEGAIGFCDRVASNRQLRDLPSDLPFFLITGRPNLGVEGGDTQELVQAIEAVTTHLCQPLAAVFVDTLVRTLAGTNENDDGMRNFTDNAEAIAERFRCLTVAVHHTGKDLTRGMRGSSALQGAVVSSWKVEKARKFQARITLEDAKDGESGITWTADLDRYVFGHDEDGDEKSVLYVKSVSEPEFELSADTEVTPKVQRQPPAQLTLFIACLETAMASGGKLDRPYRDGPKIRVVSLHTVRNEYFLRRGDDASDDAKRKSFDNQVKVAVERRLINVAATGSEKLVWPL